MADSVKDALGGYLYQFLGAAGLAACAQSLGESQDPNRRGVAVASRAGSVVHEEKDMDVVVRLTGNQSAAGVQFKYSRSAPPRPIEASELIDILDALYRSVKLSPTVEFTEFVLISNRHFAPSADRLFATRDDKAPAAALRPAPARSKRNKLAGRATALYGEAETAAEARHTILSKLSKDLAVSQTMWIDAVRAYASRRGVLPPEFDRSLATLLGRILQQTVEKSLELTGEFLNECLLGARDARSLAVDDGMESARAAASGAVREFIAGLLVEDPNGLIRRELIEEVEKQVATHSLVFVVGDGGSGKSVLAAQYLQNEVDRRFAAVALVREAEEKWAGRLVREWRYPAHPSSIGIEELAEAVARLRHANPDASRPILVLDLDGIDEVNHEQRCAVQRLLHQFWPCAAVRRPTRSCWSLPAVLAEPPRPRWINSFAGGLRATSIAAFQPRWGGFSSRISARRN